MLQKGAVVVRSISNSRPGTSSSERLKAEEILGSAPQKKSLFSKAENL
jgi:hypothetical protein